MCDLSKSITVVGAVDLSRGADLVSGLFSAHYFKSITLRVVVFCDTGLVFDLTSAAAATVFYGDDCIAISTSSSLLSSITWRLLAL